MSYSLFSFLSRVSFLPSRGGWAHACPSSVLLFGCSPGCANQGRVWSCFNISVFIVLQLQCPSVSWGFSFRLRGYLNVSDVLSLDISKWHWTVENPGWWHSACPGVGLVWWDVFPNPNSKMLDAAEHQPLLPATCALISSTNFHFFPSRILRVQKWPWKAKVLKGVK